MASETWADAQFDKLGAAYNEVPIEAKARIAELEERIGELESENAKLREADAVNDLALSYVAVKADRDAYRELVESYGAQNDVLYMKNVKLECRAEELKSLVRDMWLYLSDPETEFPCCIPVCERLREDMRALGIEVRND